MGPLTKKCATNSILVKYRVIFFPLGGGDVSEKKSPPTETVGQNYFCLLRFGEKLMFAKYLTCQYW